MPTVTAFDNINRLERRREYVKYYGEMDITPEQQRKRAQLAEDIDDLWAIFLSLILLAKMNDQQLDIQRAGRELRDGLEEAITDNGIDYEIAEDYLNDVTDNEIAVTEDRYLEGEYWTSPDRALNIALNDANTLMYAEEFSEAVYSGKTMKRWKTMRDERVRGTHREVDSVEIPIFEPFVVGDSLMLYPKDTSLGASADEIANCRCTVEYF